jgi:hypothetical protein
MDSSQLHHGAVRSAASAPAPNFRNYRLLPSAHKLEQRLGKRGHSSKHTQRQALVRG